MARRTRFEPQGVERRPRSRIGLRGLAAAVVGVAVELLAVRQIVVGPYARVGDIRVPYALAASMVMGPVLVVGLWRLACTEGMQRRYWAGFEVFGLAALGAMFASFLLVREAALVRFGAMVGSLLALVPGYGGLLDGSVGGPIAHVVLVLSGTAVIALLSTPPQLAAACVGGWLARRWRTGRSIAGGCVGTANPWPVEADLRCGDQGVEGRQPRAQADGGQA